MDDSALKVAQKTIILARFSDLKDKIVTDLFEAPFWKTLSAQNNILVSSNQRQLKNIILEEAISNLGTIDDEQESQKTTKSSSQKKPNEVAIVAPTEIPSITTLLEKNVKNFVKLNLIFFFFFIVSSYVKS